MATTGFLGSITIGSTGWSGAWRTIQENGPTRSWEDTTDLDATPYVAAGASQMAVVAATKTPLKIDPGGCTLEVYFDPDAGTPIPITADPCSITIWYPFKAGQSTTRPKKVVNGFVIGMPLSVAHDGVLVCNLQVKYTGTFAYTAGT